MLKCTPSSNRARSTRNSRLHQNATSNPPRPRGDKTSFNQMIFSSPIWKSKPEKRRNLGATLDIEDKDLEVFRDRILYDYTLRNINSL